jgi:hypothetical protein
MQIQSLNQLLKDPMTKTKYYWKNSKVETKLQKQHKEKW